MPDWLLALLAAPFCGSFVGTLALRLPIGEAVVAGRSACPTCGHPLGWRDLVPLASWLSLRGRCRHCGDGIGWFYPAVELAALGLAAWAAATAGAPLWLTCILAWWLLALALIDLRHMILPDALTLPLAAAGLASVAAVTPEALSAHLIGAAAGFAGFAAIRWAYRRWRGREGLGLGDAKLLGAAGFWVGWQGLPSIVLIAAGASLAAVTLLPPVARHVAREGRLPFGPGLCLGFWLVWLYGPLGWAWGPAPPL